MSEIPKVEKGLTPGERDSVFKQRLDTMLKREASMGEIVEVIRTWQDQEQSLINKNFSTRLHKDFVVRVAELKLAVGLIEWAIDDLYNAIDLANNYEDQEVADELRARVAKIESER
ncbi:MAG: hypothetical protein AAB667_02085 [Patescibacteria group bacterium]